MKYVHRTIISAIKDYGLFSDGEIHEWLEWIRNCDELKHLERKVSK